MIGLKLSCEKVFIERVFNKFSILKQNGKICIDLQWISGRGKLKE